MGEELNVSLAAELQLADNNKVMKIWAEAVEEY